MIVAETWGAFLTHLWNTEIISWDSLVGLFVLGCAGFIVFPRG